MSTDNFTVKRSGTGAGLLFSLFLFVGFFSPALLAAQSSSGKSTFTTKLFNLEAAVHETFRYSSTLYNGASQAQVFDLRAAAPDGWKAVFRVRGNQVTSINIESNKSEEISVEIHPAYSAEPAKYKIQVIAEASSETLQLDVEAVVMGSYGIELTTPTGRLSDDITEGSQKEVHLVVKNSGTLPLKDVSISAQSPAKWDATFEPSKIEQLEAGSTMDVVATLSVPDKTIAGDYITTFTAKENNANSTAVFRMTVKTSVLSGWIGIMVIVAAAGLVYYLIRKYGRR